MKRGFLLQKEEDDDDTSQKNKRNDNDIGNSNSNNNTNGKDNKNNMLIPMKTNERLAFGTGTSALPGQSLRSNHDSKHNHNPTPHFFRAEDRVGIVVPFGKGPATSEWGCTMTSTTTRIESRTLGQSKPCTRSTSSITIKSTETETTKSSSSLSSTSSLRTPVNSTIPYTIPSHEAIHVNDLNNSKFTNHPNLDMDHDQADDGISEVTPMNSAMSWTESLEPSAQIMDNTNQDSGNSNPYKGEPLLPCKTILVPKAALATWYGQKPRCYQLAKSDYVTWNDGGMPHQLRFTSIFVCPLSGESFASGCYSSILKSNSGQMNNNAMTSDEFHVRTDPINGATVVWYKKKMAAEHAAAARAYDCFSYRHFYGTRTRSVQLGLDPPYLDAIRGKELENKTIAIPHSTTTTTTATSAITSATGTTIRTPSSSSSSSSSSSTAARVLSHASPPLLPMDMPRTAQDQIKALLHNYERRQRVLEWNENVDRQQRKEDEMMTLNSIISTPREGTGENSK